MSREFNTQQQFCGVFFSFQSHRSKKNPDIQLTGHGHGGILGTAASVEGIAELILVLKILRAKVVERARCEACDVS